MQNLTYTGRRKRNAIKSCALMRVSKGGPARRSWSEAAAGGQAAIIIVLVTLVVVTIALAQMTRTTTDVAISSQSEEGTQALAAAEAGVEAALLDIKNDGCFLTPCSGNGEIDIRAVDPKYADFAVSQYSYEVKKYPFDPAVHPSYSLGEVKAGDVRTIYLREDWQNFGSDVYKGNITIEWDPGAAIVEVIVYYEESGNYKVARTKVESGKVELKRDSGPYWILGSDPTWLFVRVKPLSGDLTDVTVSDYSNSFPAQGHNIVANGDTTTGVEHRIEMFRMYNQPPAFLDYLIISGEEITK